MRLFTVITILALTTSASLADDDLGWLKDQLAILADSDHPAAAREAAERSLLDSSDARLLRPLFHMLHDLTADWRMYTLAP